MIEAFLKHHLDRLRYEPRINALKDCHVRGLDSIMLHEEPQNRIRMFYAHRDHELHLNDPRFDVQMPAQTLALHSHRCDVRLVPLFGPVMNYVVDLREEPNGRFHECEYRSAIRQGEGRLERTGKRFAVDSMSHSYLNETPHGLALVACELHGVFVPEGCSAAWLVIEGEEDPEYDALCYTQNPVFDSDGMYAPMSSGEARALLESVRRSVRA